MKSQTCLPLLLLGLLLASCRAPAPVDTIYLNGRIFTAADTQPFASAMALQNGRIAAVGDNENIRSHYAAGDSNVIDLHGQLVLPGFHDAHLHLWNGARLRRRLDLRRLTSKEAVLEKIRERVRKAEPGEWILGRGWDHELWNPRELPDRRDLDRISTRHYIFLERVDGHAAWVNGSVLKLLHYTAQTVDPAGGKIMRFPNSRVPNGILFDNAYDILDKIVPEPTFTQKYEMLQEVLQYANSLGITSVTDNSPLNLYGVYREMLDRGQLTVRINFWINYIENLDSLRGGLSYTHIDSTFLQANLIKIYADGSLGSRTALLQKPYDDDPGNSGLPRHSLQELTHMVAKADSLGFQLGIHGIGDGAVRQILDAYQAVAQGTPRKDRRWRIEHAQVLDSSDFQRFADLGVIASMQPSHCITDMHWAGERISRRTRWAYAWNTFLQHGVPLAFGTDWVVEPLNPMVGLYAAITRQDTLGFPPQAWYPQERLTLAQAVRAYTRGSAYAARSDRWTGTLEPGKAADFVILDRDIFSAAPRELLHARVLATYVGGKKVYPRGEDSEE